jgi:hypothetical protein
MAAKKGGYQSSSVYRMEQRGPTAKATRVRQAREQAREHLDAFECRP